MKAITGPKSILFYKTLKIIHGRISVSPGHIDDALYSQIKCEINIKQAGAELGQAQLKLGLDFNSINLN